MLARLDVLPQEGANEAHALYRETKLMLAIDAAAARRWKEAAALVAAAREWPESLGEGKPYEADVDERLEDWLSASILERSGRREEAVAIWQRLAADTRQAGSASDVLRLWSLDRLGRGAEAAAALREWSTSRLTTGVEGRILTAWRRALSPQAAAG